jgi:hypothetical protein
MKTIRLICPSCAQPIETDLATAAKGLVCPGCGRDLRPENFPSRPAPPEHFAPADKALLKRRKQIRQQAEGFAHVAGFCVFIGIVSVPVAIVGKSEIACIICGAAFSVALWFYLTAQIIHIRANTEK